jgi:hypothetical protein
MQSGRKRHRKKKFSIPRIKVLCGSVASETSEESPVKILNSHRFTGPVYVVGFTLETGWRLAHILDIAYWNSGEEDRLFIIKDLLTTDRTGRNEEIELNCLNRRCPHFSLPSQWKAMLVNHSSVFC